MLPRSGTWSTGGGLPFKGGANNAVIAGPFGFVIVKIEMIILDGQRIKGPQPLLGMVVKLLRDQNMIQAFARTLMHVGVVNIPS